MNLIIVLGNHSCVANTEITFPHNNSTLALKAVEDIQVGEVRLFCQSLATIKARL